MYFERWESVLFEITTMVYAFNPCLIKSQWFFVCLTYLLYILRFSWIKYKRFFLNQWYCIWDKSCTHRHLPHLQTESCIVKLILSDISIYIIITCHKAGEFLLSTWLLLAITRTAAQILQSCPYGKESVVEANTSNKRRTFCLFKRKWVIVQILLFNSVSCFCLSIYATTTVGHIAFLLVVRPSIRMCVRQYVRPNSCESHSSITTKWTCLKLSKNV